MEKTPLYDWMRQEWRPDADVTFYILQTDINAPILIFSSADGFGAISAQEITPSSEALLSIRASLGSVDGFDQDYAACQGDKGGVILCGLLASHGDALKALQFAECLLDTGAAFVECFCEEGGLVLGV